MQIETSLSDILERPGEFPWDCHIYASKGAALRLDSLVIVHSDDEEIEQKESDEPAFTESKNMRYVCGIAAVQDILENLKQQISGPGLQLKYQAVLYYLQNDAFLRITNNR